MRKGDHCRCFNQNMYWAKFFFASSLLEFSQGLMLVHMVGGHRGRGKTWAFKFLMRILGSVLGAVEVEVVGAIWWKESQ